MFLDRISTIIRNQSKIDSGNVSDPQLSKQTEHVCTPSPRFFASRADSDLKRSKTKVRSSKFEKNLNATTQYSRYKLHAQTIHTSHYVRIGPVHTTYEGI